MENASGCIRDVMMPDGLQNLQDLIATDVKIELFRRLVASGLRRIEFTSFVSPKAVPQFADASQVARAVVPITPPGVEVSALIPNLKGAQLALDSGVRRLAFVMSVSESHNINNVYMFEAMGITTGINIDALLGVARYFQSVEADIHFSSNILEAGVPTYLGAVAQGGTEQKWS